MYGAVEDVDPVNLGNMRAPVIGAMSVDAQGQLVDTDLALHGNIYGYVESIGDKLNREMFQNEHGERLNPDEVSHNIAIYAAIVRQRIDSGDTVKQATANIPSPYQQIAELEANRVEKDASNDLSLSAVAGVALADGNLAASASAQLSNDPRVREKEEAKAEALQAVNDQLDIDAKLVMMRLLEAFHQQFIAQEKLAIEADKHPAANALTASLAAAGLANTAMDCVDLASLKLPPAIPVASVSQGSRGATR